MNVHRDETCRVLAAGKVVARETAARTAGQPGGGKLGNNRAALSAARRQALSGIGIGKNADGQDERHEQQRSEKQRVVPAVEIASVRHGKPSRDLAR